jgi:arsenate reductase
VGKGSGLPPPAALQRRLERTFCASLLKHSIAQVSHNETVNVQIFGVKNSQATRAAERFFKERRVQIQLVNIKQKPMAPGEINRFIQRFGLNELIDREGKAFLDSGLKYLRVSDSEILAKIENDPLLLRLPLIRAGNLLSIGHNEEAWKAMLVKP